jgi:HSP20 family molecular chaperone IbpA
MKYYPNLNRFDLFDDFFQNGYSTNSVMKTDIVENAEDYTLAIEVPGVAKENIQIELKNGYLKVSANTEANKEDTDNKGRIIRKERAVGSYSRSFYVGENIDAQDVKASFENGILNIVIPKEQKKIEQKKFISIE